MSLQQDQLLAECSSSKGWTLDSFPGDGQQSFHMNCSAKGAGRLPLAVGW